jgi:hypothetical protein
MRTTEITVNLSETGPVLSRILNFLKHLYSPKYTVESTAKLNNQAQPTGRFTGLQEQKRRKNEREKTKEKDRNEMRSKERKRKIKSVLLNNGAVYIFRM